MLTLPKEIIINEVIPYLSPLDLKHLILVGHKFIHECVYSIETLHDKDSVFKDIKRFTRLKDYSGRGDNPPTHIKSLTYFLSNVENFEGLYDVFESLSLENYTYLSLSCREYGEIQSVTVFKGVLHLDSVYDDPNKEYWDTEQESDLFIKFVEHFRKFYLYEEFSCTMAFFFPYSYSKVNEYLSGIPELHRYNISPGYVDIVISRGIKNKIDTLVGTHIFVDVINYFDRDRIVKIEGELEDETVIKEYFHNVSW